MPSDNIEPLSEVAAQHAHDVIQRDLARLSANLFDFRERKGYHALGYSNWTAYCKAELDKSVSYLGRLCQCEAINRDLELSMDKRLNQNQTKVLAGYPPEDRPVIYKIARNKADQYNGGKMTGGIIKSVGESIKLMEYPGTVDPGDGVDVMAGTLVVDKDTGEIISADDLAVTNSVLENFARRVAYSQASDPPEVKRVTLKFIPGELEASIEAMAGVVKRITEPDRALLVTALQALVF